MTLLLVICWQVLSSGYVVTNRCSGETDGPQSGCCVMYFHQLSSTVLPYFGADIVGLTAILTKTAKRLKSYVTEQLTATHGEVTKSF